MIYPPPRHGSVLVGMHILEKIVRKNKLLVTILRKIIRRYNLRHIKIENVPPARGKPVKIIGFVKCYNEAKNGRLSDCLTHLKTFCDDIVFLDNSSTDNSLEIAKQFTSNIISLPNEFTKEMEHKQKLLEKALELDPDWIVWLDPDEVLGIDETSDEIQRLCQYGDKKGIDAFVFRSYNLWRSLDKYRVDSNFYGGSFTKLWKNTGNLSFDIKEGLHHRHYPNSLVTLRYVNIKMIHFGFSSKEYIDEKYEMYKKHGQTGYSLEWLRDESTLKRKKFPAKWYPQSIRKKIHAID